MFHFGLDEYSKDMLLSLTIKLVLVHDDDKHLATFKSFSVQRYFKYMETTRCHSNTYYVNLDFVTHPNVVFLGLIQKRLHHFPVLIYTHCGRMQERTRQ